ncbi:MAG: hypothetical protein ACSHXY_08530 [Alphaproteobacteria bacterium]
MARIVLILTVLFMGVCETAFANDKDAPDTASPLGILYECALISGDTERLACFDSNVAALQVKEEKKEIVALDAASAKTIKREAFGFSLPSLPKLGLPSLSSSDDAPDALTFDVKSVKKKGRNYVFYMKNGQVWEQANGTFNYIPKGDLKATIKSGSIGSFRMSLSNGKERVRGMGVRRVE